MSKKLKNGDIFILFAIIYSFGRFFLEFMKVDQSKLWGMGTNQLIMAVGLCWIIGFISYPSPSEKSIY